MSSTLIINKDSIKLQISAITFQSESTSNQERKMLFQIIIVLYLMLAPIHPSHRPVKYETNSHPDR